MSIYSIDGISLLDGKEVISQYRQELTTRHDFRELTTSLRSNYKSGSFGMASQAIPMDRNSIPIPGPIYTTKSHSSYKMYIHTVVKKTILVHIKYMYRIIVRENGCSFEKSAKAAIETAPGEPFGSARKILLLQVCKSLSERFKGLGEPVQLAPSCFMIGPFYVTMDQNGELYTGSFNYLNNYPQKLEKPLKILGEVIHE